MVDAVDLVQRLDHELDLVPNGQIVDPEPVGDLAEDHDLLVGQLDLAREPADFADRIGAADAVAVDSDSLEARVRDLTSAGRGSPRGG